MADSIDVTVDVAVEVRSPGWQLLSLCNEAVHEIAEEYTGMVSRFLKVEVFLFHQHRQDVVPLEAFRLLYVVAIDILKGGSQLTDRRQG